MFHKHRAAIGRESSRPASRGAIAQLEPRRRNCRRAISLAATKQVGQKRFLREKSRFCGGPQNAGQPFGRQGISSPVNAAGIPVGCQVFGKKALPVAGRHTCIHLQCIWPRGQNQHPFTQVPRRSAFWPKPQKAPKTLFPLHPAASTNESPAPHRVRQAAPSALSCRPVHARSPALSGRLLWAGAAS